MQLGSCWCNRNATHGGISLSVIQATVPVSMSGTLVCTVPKERDVISGLLHQDMTPRLSEGNVAAGCTGCSSRAACFVSPWSHSVALRKARSPRGHHRKEVLWNGTVGRGFWNKPKNVMHRKRQKKTKQLSPVFLIKMLSAVVAIAKHDNRAWTCKFRNIQSVVRHDWTN